MIRAAHARAALALALIATGCASDPCDGLPGTCVSLTIVSQLVDRCDVLPLTVESSAGGFFSSVVERPGGIALPARLPLVIPDSQERLEIGAVVACTEGNTIVARGTSVGTSVFPGGHARDSVELFAIEDAPPPPDFARPPDLAQPAIDLADADLANADLAAGPDDLATVDLAKIHHDFALSKNDLAPITDLGGLCPDEMIAVVSPDHAWPYCIDKHEATIGEYDAFTKLPSLSQYNPPECGNHVNFSVKCASQKPDSNLSNVNHPVACLNWCDAASYCTSRGKRLCGLIGTGGQLDYGEPGFDYFNTDATVDEWYNACSAGGVLVFPYHGKFDATRCATASTQTWGPRDVGTANCEGGFAGLEDMIGNVGEWTNACSFDRCSQRGGSWQQLADSQTCGWQVLHYRTDYADTVGVRCCK